MTQVGSELVILNPESDQAICLNQISAIIWRLCDGRSGIAGIAAAATHELGTPVSEELVQFALRELQRKNLLERQELVQAAMVSRRDLVRRLGSAATVLLPLATLVAIPRKMQASGGGGLGCVLGDSPVQMASGSWIPAVDVRAGMWLQSFDPSTCERRVAEVHGVRQVTAPSLWTLFTERGDLLQSSPSHLLISGPGDVEGTAVADLRVGDKVMVFERTNSCMLPTRVSGIQTSDVECPVYAIEMNSLEHTYVSGGLVSHNATTKDFRSGVQEQWMADAQERRDDYAEEQQRSRSRELLDSSDEQ